MTDFTIAPPAAGEPAALFKGASEIKSSWLAIDQPMIDLFAKATLDPDPMHIDPDWAARNSPFGTTIAFGFLTISLLTHLLHEALESGPGANGKRRGVFLNYGFDRLRLVSPVPAGARVRGRFRRGGERADEKGRWVVKFESVIEIEGEAKPALVGTWLSMWVPPA